MAKPPLKQLLPLRFFLLFISAFFICQCSNAQILISGKLVDVTKINTVEGALVSTISGRQAITDSFGRFKILAMENDSIYFTYNGKATLKFAVSSIPVKNNFEVALKIPVKSRYTTLQEVVLISKSYQQDSVENRDDNRDIFNYKKPGISTSVSPTGGAGADVNELINIFRFRRNKRLAFFQKFMEEQEQNRYVDFRFSKKVVKRITQLDGNRLDSFMVWYRPSYEFTANSSEIEFNQYILNSLYQYRRIMPLEGKKEGE